MPHSSPAENLRRIDKAELNLAASSLKNNIATGPDTVLRMKRSKPSLPKNPKCWKPCIKKMVNQISNFNEEVIKVFMKKKDRRIDLEFKNITTV